MRGLLARLSVDFGDNDLYRARVALGGLAALPQQEAMYIGARQDAVRVFQQTSLGGLRTRLEARPPASK